MADQTQYGSRARRAPPPADAGKIERWHQTLKNRILLENYYLPGDLEAKIDAFVDHYNHRRYHESLGNRFHARWPRTTFSIVRISLRTVRRATESERQERQAGVFTCTARNQPVRMIWAMARASLRSVSFGMAPMAA
jgi:hypothetical protein